MDVFIIYHQNNLSLICLFWVETSESIIPDFWNQHPFYVYVYEFCFSIYLLLRFIFIKLVVFFLQFWNFFNIWMFHWFWNYQLLIVWFAINFLVNKGSYTLRVLYALIIVLFVRLTINLQSRFDLNIILLFFHLNFI